MPDAKFSAKFMPGNLRNPGNYAGKIPGITPESCAMKPAGKKHVYVYPLTPADRKGERVREERLWTTRNTTTGRGPAAAAKASAAAGGKGSQNS